MLQRTCAALTLACTLCSQAAAQATGERPDSLPVDSILVILFNEALAGRDDTGRATAELVRQGAFGAARTDSLLLGLRDLAVNGPSNRVRSAAVRVLGASGTANGQAAILLAVLEQVNDARTLRTILQLAPVLPDSAARRRLILRGLEMHGDRNATFVAGMALMIALRMGDEGRVLLAHAVEQGIIRDQRTLDMAGAALVNVPRAPE